MTVLQNRMTVHGERSGIELMENHLKTCFYCGEAIKKEALKCKYCKSDCSGRNKEEEQETIQRKQFKTIDYPQKTTLIALLTFSILGYGLYEYFSYTENSCDDELVITTLKRLYAGEYGHEDLSVSYITTLNQTSNTRSCSALMESSRCKRFSVDYEIKIPDSRKGFTIQSEDQCALQERLRDIEKLRERAQRDLEAFTQESEIRKQESEKAQKELESSIRKIEREKYFENYLKPLNSR